MSEEHGHKVLISKELEKLVESDRNFLSENRTMQTERMGTFMSGSNTAEEIRNHLSSRTEFMKHGTTFASGEQIIAESKRTRQEVMNDLIAARKQYEVDDRQPFEQSHNKLSVDVGRMEAAAIALSVKDEILVDKELLKKMEISGGHDIHPSKHGTHSPHHGSAKQQEAGKEPHK